MTRPIEQERAGSGAGTPVDPALPGPCIFTGCVSTDRHWHGGFPGGYDNPDDPDGPPIEFTSEPAPGVRDYNGALLPDIRVLIAVGPDEIDEAREAYADWIDVQAKERE